MKDLVQKVLKLDVGANLWAEDISLNFSMKRKFVFKNIEIFKK